MKLQQRNLVKIWYALYDGQRTRYDAEDFEDGMELVYATPVAIRCNVSPASGQSQIETFGNLESYDKIILTDDLHCPIDENTVLFIDHEPDATGENFDYVVKRIAKSLNFIAYAISKVKVTAL